MLRNILVVDDIATNRLILKGILHQDYMILEAANGEDALDILRRGEQTISAVLLDISMPGIDGFEVLNRIRSDKRYSQLPVIMITGSEDKETRIKSLALGANDFVMKPYSAEIIKHCLQNNIAFREAMATVNALRRDRLTGLYSRESFFDKVREMVSAHEAGYYVMACFDIDQFKVINDQYGTQKGDEVLQHIADAFAEGFEPHGGICCRISADNFAVLYPADFQHSDEIRAIRERAAQIEGIVTPIIFSIGRYVVADASLSPAAMYDRATLAAASVKGRYDVKIALYDDAMRERLLREQEIVCEMENALKSGQFEVWFQPQYNHSTGARIGAEALVRWRHPERGLIPPGSFIPIFEKNGFIYALDQFVWERVCRYLRKWLDEGRAPLPVSVNISRYDVLRPELTQVLMGLIRRYDLPMDLLRLEITESAFSESAQHIVEVVRELLRRGFTVEIDDFGSGYSSLNTLKDVPAQIVKLDMMFLASGDDAQRGGNIVESVVRMAKWLDMAVIAEGVETAAQADYLRSIGCSYVQGYLYAKPMPAGEYELRCKNGGREERLLTLETVENLDNNAFWSPESMDTLIFNSYVGGACIYEYQDGRIELLRATEKYAQVIGSAGMTVEDALRLNWTEHLDEENLLRVKRNTEQSIRTKSEVTGEYVFHDLPNCPCETYLRSTIRVIASAGDRHLVYCTNENITAQRTSEERESLAAKQLSAIMENINGGVTATVVEGDTLRRLFANDMYYRQLGYTREQYEARFSGTPISILPEDAAGVMAQARALSADRRPGTIEFRIRRADGAIRWLRSCISIMDYPGEKEPVQLSVTLDITEQREAEQEVQRVSEQMQAIMDNVDLGILAAVVSGGTARYLFANDRYYNMLGYTRAQFAAEIHSPYQTVAPCDRERIMEKTFQINATGQSAVLVYRALAREGGERIFRAAIAMGRLTGIDGPVQFTILRDITQETEAERREQVRQEEIQRDLLDHLPGGAGVYELRDGQLSLVYQNKSYWELVGLPEAQLIDPAPMSAIHPDDVPIILRELHMAIEQGRDLVCDIRLRHLTKGYRSAHLVGRVEPQKEGGYAIYATFSLNDENGMSYQRMLPAVLSAIMESTTDLSFAKDARFRYLTSSRAFAQMVGQRSEHDVIGKTDYDLFDKELADKFRRDDEALLAGGRALIDMTEVIPSKDGTPRYSSTSKYPLRDGSGQVIGLYGVGRDITKAVVQKNQLKLVNDSVPGGIATYAFRDGGVRIAYCNDGFCRLFGGTHEGFEARGEFDPLDWVFEEDRAALMARIRALVENDVPMDVLYRIHVLDGGFKWINEKASTTERKGDTVRFNALLLDVTERQIVNEQLRISEEESNLAVQHGGSIVCRYDVAERTLTISRDAAKVYALAPKISDVPYEPVRLGLISPESADAYIGFFEAILNGGKEGTALYQQRQLDEWRWMEAKSTTIFSDEGKPVRAVISLFDVTDRLEKETIYKKWQHSLEDRAANSYTLFRCNLNRNTPYETREGTLLSFAPDDAGPGFNERSRAYADQCVDERDRERYIAFANSDVMLAGYYRGRRSDTIEYRERMEPGASFRWIRLTIDLVESPLSTDVEAYMLYEDIDRAKKEELQTKERSETDPLTGVMNRTTFAANVDRILRSAGAGARHAMLMLDIDGFKRVNDAFGHAAGDRALIELAGGLRAIMRHDDLVARLGGDEFVVFLMNILDERAALNKARQMGALARRTYSAEVQISASIGIVFAPRDGTTFEALYQKADAALYYVKGTGKDNYAVYGAQTGE